MDKKDLAQDKKTAAKTAAGAVHAHEKKLHPGQPMTKLAKGGKTNAQMKSLGRGLAKVANQKKSSFTYKKGA
jgi:hypothetical protein